MHGHLRGKKTNRADAGTYLSLSGIASQWSDSRHASTRLPASVGTPSGIGRDSRRSDRSDELMPLIGLSTPTHPPAKEKTLRDLPVPPPVKRPRPLQRQRLLARRVVPGCDHGPGRSVPAGLAVPPYAVLRL